MPSTCRTQRALTVLLAATLTLGWILGSKANSEEQAEDVGGSITGQLKVEDADLERLRVTPEVFWGQVGIYIKDPVAMQAKTGAANPKKPKEIEDEIDVSADLPSRVEVTTLGNPLFIRNVGKKLISCVMALQNPKNRKAIPSQLLVAPGARVRVDLHAEELPITMFVFSKPSVEDSPCQCISLITIGHMFGQRVREDGRFRLNGLPPGDYRLQVWGQKVGFECLRDHQSGCISVSVKAGKETDLGTIIITTHDR